MKLFLNVVPHQDDELITLGIPTIHSIEAGEENHVLICTDGSGSYVFNLLKSGKPCRFSKGTYHYNLTLEKFVRARDREFLSSCKAIGYKKENIHIPENRLKDGTLTIDGAYDLIKEFLIKTKLSEYGEIIVRTLSPYGDKDQHGDHRNLGLAVLRLLEEDIIDEVEFYQEPYCIAGLEKVHPDFNVEEKSCQSEKIQKAVNSYKTWRPLLGRYGVGYHSVPGVIDDFSKNPISYKITPKVIPCLDYIYNRPDLFAKEYETYDILSKEGLYEFMVTFKGENAEVAARLSAFPQRVGYILSKKIFKAHPEIKNVSFKYIFEKIGDAKATNFFTLDFPETEEELMDRLSRHDRKNLRRRLKNLEEEQGAVEFKEYSEGEIPDEVVESFFRYKKISHGREYNMTPSQYLEFYHVTNAYTIYLNGEMIAVRFTCEQRDIVNAENLAYSLDYDKYSLGLMIYNYSLRRLVQKGKKAIMLSDGHQPQKFLYGSVDHEVYNCTVKREHLGKMDQEPELIFEQFYSRLATDKPVQKNPHNTAFSFVRIDDPRVFIDFCNEYTSSITKQVIPRFYKGSYFCAIICDKTRVCSGWVAFDGPFRINEVKGEVNLSGTQKAILYDFFTEPEYRCQGAYAFLLEEMMTDSNIEEYIIYARPDNIASNTGIQKVGFKYEGTYSYKNIEDYYLTKGFKKD